MLLLKCSNAHCSSLQPSRFVLGLQSPCASAADVHRDAASTRYVFGSALGDVLAAHSCKWEEDIGKVRRQTRFRSAEQHTAWGQPVYR